MMDVRILTTGELRDRKVVEQHYGRDNPKTTQVVIAKFASDKEAVRFLELVYALNGYSTEVSIQSNAKSEKVWEGIFDEYKAKIRNMLGIMKKFGDTELPKGCTVSYANRRANFFRSMRKAAGEDR